MKALNLVALSLGGALVVVYAASLLFDFLLGDSAPIVIAPLALIVGMSARKTTEKFLGYTLEEAMKEGKDE